MRFVALAALVALAVPRDADACFEPAFEQHELDRSQLSDRVAPGTVSVSMWIEEADNGGCTTPQSRCSEPTGRYLVLMVSASDDSTPPDRLGFRVDVTAGHAPFPMPGDVRAVDEQLRFRLADDADLDFELGVRAIDLNGNVGPATYVYVMEANADGGCAAHHASFGMIAVAIAFVISRRRRR